MQNDSTSPYIQITDEYNTDDYNEAKYRDRTEYTLVQRNYGKNFVKVLHVNRSGKHHSIKEIEVNTRLTLVSDKDFLNADNSDIVATDTQKNIVYVLARKYGVKTPEDFGMLACNFFLTKYNHIEEVTVTVEEYPWQRIKLDNKGHNHAFIFVPSTERYAIVSQRRKGVAQVTSGLRGLRVLKTTQSSFTDFYSDEYRTLPDTADRIFSTVITSSWKYADTSNLDFDREWYGVKECILREFAGNPDSGMLSQSVQHTLYQAQKRILDRHPQIAEVKMDMPNKHYWDVNLSSFPEVGKQVNKSVYLPVDKPAGHIHAILSRKPSAKL